MCIGIIMILLLQRVLALHALRHIQYDSLSATRPGYSCYGYWGWSLIWAANCTQTRVLGSYRKDVRSICINNNFYK